MEVTFPETDEEKTAGSKNPKRGGLLVEIGYKSCHRVFCLEKKYGIQGKLCKPFVNIPLEHDGHEGTKKTRGWLKVFPESD